MNGEDIFVIVALLVGVIAVFVIRHKIKISDEKEAERQEQLRKENTEKFLNAGGLTRIAKKMARDISARISPVRVSERKYYEFSFGSSKQYVNNKNNYDFELRMYRRNYCTAVDYSTVRLTEMGYNLTDVYDGDMAFIVIDEDMRYKVRQLLKQELWNKGISCTMSSNGYITKITF